MAITLVQSAQKTSTTTSTSIKQYTSNVTVGNLLVACCATFDSGGAHGMPSSAWSDSMGNTWAAAGPGAWTPGSAGYSIRFATAVVGGGSQASPNTVTVAWVGGAACPNQLQVFELAGAASASVVDNTTTGTNTSTNPSTSLAVGTANCAGFAMLVTQTVVPTAGSGFTIPFAGGGTGGTGAQFERLEYKLDLGAAGTIAFTYSMASDLWDMYVLAIKPAAGGGTLLAINGITVSSGVSHVQGIAKASLLNYNGLTF